jgi:hypothetical protein
MATNSYQSALPIRPAGQSATEAPLRTSDLSSYEKHFNRKDAKNAKEGQVFI